MLELLGDEMRPEDRLYTMWAWARSPMRALVEMATMTGKGKYISKFDAFPIADPSSDVSRVYEKSNEIYSFFEIMSPAEAEIEIASYAESPGYTSAYYRGYLQVKKKLGGSIESASDKIKSFMVYGTLPMMAREMDFASP